MSRIAIVTGAGSGIGAAAARALAANGWTVVLTGRRRAPLEQVAADDARMVVMPADVTDERAVQTLFDDDVARCGRVDLLFNNAGRGAPAVPLDETTLADFAGVLAVDVTGVFLCTREAFRVMRGQDPQGGRIINNGSISAHVPRPHAVSYTAAKHAVTGLTKSTALDGRPFAIACGQLDIGNAATDMTERMGDGTLQADGTLKPEPRMDVSDVARAVVHMASLPLDATVASMTVMATGMPFVGRG